MERLTSIMESDRFSYRRGHAQSGFEMDSIDDIIAIREKQSSIAGKTNEDDDDENEEYVALSEYEVDTDDLVKMNE